MALGPAKQQIATETMEGILIQLLSEPVSAGVGGGEFGEIGGGEHRGHLKRLGNSWPLPTSSGS